MYHQFKELADVDITKEPMEVGPTCHYVMGGVEVDPDTAMSIVPGLFAAGEVAGGMHGSNRLGGNSLSDLLVFGRRAGVGAAEYVDGLAGVRPAVLVDDVQAAQDRALLPFSSATEGGENPFKVQLELQKTMHELVGIIRKEDEMRLALKKLEDIATRRARCRSPGTASSTPAGTSRSICATCCWCRCASAKAALERQESRGGPRRDDFPDDGPDWRHGELVLRALGEDDVELRASGADRDASRVVRRSSSTS